MRYLALATDYDGTLASQGRVDESAIAALESLRKSGRKLILVSGRHLEDLLTVFPRLDIFDYAVLENGALLYEPKTKTETVLAEKPPDKFLQALRDRGVPIAVGRAIVATWHPHETTVLEVIKELGLELHVIFNKGAVMVLPSSVNKATGLAAALKELSLSEHNVVAIGDAENDHAFLAASECSVAVANALPSLKERADITTKSGHGAGVVEIIDQLLKDDLASRSEGITRHRILLGQDGGGQEVRIPAYGPCVLVAGPSGSGKSTIITALLERLCDQQYQFCVIDPEGDYEQLLNSVTVGGAKTSPATAEIRALLQQYKDTVINLLGISLDDRPAHFAELLPTIQELRTRSGRPHWIVIDEAHHLLPTSWVPGEISLAQTLRSTIMITVHPDHVSPRVLALVDTLIVMGDHPSDTLSSFCKASGRAVPKMSDEKLESGEVLFWRPAKEQSPTEVKVQHAHTERQRHRRKYAEGDIHDKSFFFRGPQGKLNLKAQNLAIFLQIAEGVDDETWNFHLKQRDYSRWIHEAIKDDDLAARVKAIEEQRLSPKESRRRIREAIAAKYTEAA